MTLYEQTKIPLS